MKPSDRDLRPYGYAPPAINNWGGWCVKCRKHFRDLAAKAFKCRPCAADQWRDVERECREAAPLPVNRVPND